MAAAIVSTERSSNVTHLHLADFTTANHCPQHYFDQGDLFSEFLAVPKVYSFGLMSYFRSISVLFVGKTLLTPQQRLVNHMLCEKKKESKRTNRALVAAAGL